MRSKYVGFFFKTAITTVLGLSMIGNADASTSQPAGLNLGATSFGDGFARPTPGFVYEQYFQYFDFSAINDKNGNAIGRPVFNNQHIGAEVSLNQIIYLSPIHLFGGLLGATVLLPIVNSFSYNDTPSFVSLKAVGFGMGDLTWGAFLQMPPIFNGGRPVFVQRFEFDVISPTGTYSTKKDVNDGAGYWSLNPHYEFSVLPTPKTMLSVRLHYLYNFRNDNPASSTPLPSGSNYQAGQAFWTNFDVAYAVLPKLYVGMNGYYFQQFTQDKIDRVSQADSETTNLSIGPGLFYTANAQNLFFANAYLPVIEKNTTSGFHLVARWVHFF